MVGVGVRWMERARMMQRQRKSVYSSLRNWMVLCDGVGGGAALCDGVGSGAALSDGIGGGVARRFRASTGKEGGIGALGEGVGRLLVQIQLLHEQAPGEELAGDLLHHGLNSRIRPAWNSREPRK